MPTRTSGTDEAAKKIKIYPLRRTRNPTRGYRISNGKPQLLGPAQRDGLLDSVSRMLSTASQWRSGIASSWRCSNRWESRRASPSSQMHARRRILTQATLVGEAMAKAILLQPAPVTPTTSRVPTGSSPPSRHPTSGREHYDEIDGRAAWFYEAVTNNIAMHAPQDR